MGNEWPTKTAPIWNSETGSFKTWFTEYKLHCLLINKICVCSQQEREETKLRGFQNLWFLFFVSVHIYGNILSVGDLISWFWQPTKTTKISSPRKIVLSKYFFVNIVVQLEQHHLLLLTQEKGGYGLVKWCVMEQYRIVLVVKILVGENTIVHTMRT